MKSLRDLCITLGDNQHNYYLLAREKFMPRFLCDGWTLENRLEQPIDYLCNNCIPWSWKEGDVNKSTMREIDEETYSKLVSSVGVKLFPGAPLDFNPNSINEGFYDDYVFIHLYQLVVIYLDDEMDSKYKFIESRRFSDFMGAIRTLHLYELPEGWKNYDFERTQDDKGRAYIRGFAFWSPPLFKIFISNSNEPTEKEFKVQA